MKIQTLIKLEVTQHVLNHAHLGADGSGLWVFTRVASKGGLSFRHGYPLSITQELQFTAA